MTLERPFRLSVLTLVGTGLAALTLAVGSAPWLLGGFGLFLALVLLSIARPRWHIRRGAATVGVAIILQMAVVEVLVTRTALVPAAHFLILTQLVWLSQERASRHYAWLCLVSLLQMMLAGVLSVDLAYGVCLLIYLPVGVLALLLFNLRSELERRQMLTPSRLAELRVGRRLFSSAAFVTLVELVLTILVFMYFPRFGLQLLQLRPVQRGPRLSGFSDEVRLGDIARILDNPEVVMSVRLSRDGRPIRAAGFPLLWRGISLDTYEDGRWKTLGYLSDESTRHPLDYPERRPRANWTHDVVQEIALEPVNSRVLFHLQRPMQIRKASPNLERVEFHRISGTFSSVGGSSVSVRYVVHSRLPDRTPAELQMPARGETEWPFNLLLRDRAPTPWHRKYDRTGRFTQLPASLRPPVAALARRIVAGIPSEQVYRRILQVETYLRGNYTYTLEPGLTARGVDPIEDFLLNTRRGHCELFAAGMVVLLRALHIPARMVTGFRGGEWNEYGQFYIVRQRHAHAWVEARLPVTHLFWQSFDPTPPAPEAPASQGWLSRLSRRLAYLRVSWNTWVVNYSSTDQRHLAEAVTRVLSRLPNYLPLWGTGQLALDSGVSAGVRAVAVLGGLAVVVGGGVVLLVWLRRRARRRARRRGHGGRPAIGFYRRTLDLLRRRGFPRDPTLTPLEFAERAVADGGPAYEPVRDISRAFCRVFYGGGHLTHGESVAVGEALAALERETRK
ncbi:DUF3488 domain-containing protein [bacterium]|nr:DUF3488 domain-containing protein [bacterium]